mmetsp:Transcript_45802/g.92432  ORF Transcript_45802/g.92432 Transcript_45802/m.92432 type:complete len:109 (+) Transcript_45802:357-683(+)
MCAGLKVSRQRDSEKLAKQKTTFDLQAKLLGERKFEVLALRAQFDERGSEREHMETELKKSFGREMELRKGMRRGMAASGISPNTYRAYDTPLPRIKGVTSASSSGRG